VVKRFCTFAIVALAIAPTTVPFRGWNMLRVPSVISDDPVSLEAPTMADTDRSKVALASALASRSFVVSSPVAFRTRSVATAHRLPDDSILSTVLRR
jgi:hypothetical protein